ncbi:YdcH family protein [Paracoccus sp. (in: a-proteobacteria)]|uniref:YdcH family protein n=1 Tax=Paracoccus sp. TaxID=267 RepID=UPI0034CF6B4A
MFDLICRTTAKEDGMSVTSHVEELRKKHQNLSEAVEKEQKRPGSDDFAIAQMKREKLRIKEAISRLTH